MVEPGRSAHPDDRVLDRRSLHPSSCCAAPGDVTLGERERPRIVLLGPPGAGKGTQGKLLARRLDLVHLSTGELLRDAAAGDSFIGRRARRFMEEGRLVPDELVLDLLRTQLDGHAPGLVLDGIPRTVEQAGALAELLGARPVDAVIELTISETTALTRLRGRNRHDDGVLVVRQRFDDYEALTRPVLSWYRQRHPVWRIDGDQPPADVTAEIVSRLDELDPSIRSLALEP
jgi:adenylate kinase